VAQFEESTLKERPGLEKMRNNLDGP
jgi:hypothetical protein